MPKKPEQHFSSVEGASEDFFRVLERSKSYKDMEKLVRKALESQWQDLVVSGIINSLFRRYKDFFVNRRGTKIKIRKDFEKAPIDDQEEDDEVRSIADIKAQEKETLQRDRLIVDPKFLNQAALSAFITQLITNKATSIGSYYNFRPDTKGYLKQIANKGGQTIIDQIKTPKHITFRLSKKEYITKINDRVDTLIRNLDKTTKKRMVSELAKGLKLGETKAQMTRRLTSKGVGIAKTRAKTIVATETEAVAEWMRYETARMNGAEIKVWETAADERVCPTCQPLDGVRKPIGVNFESMDYSGKYPPAHPLCRCSVHYEINSNQYLDYIEKGHNVHDKVDALFLKAKKYTFYSTKGDGKPLFTITNTNAVWAGGESLVGHDKMVGSIYYDITNQTDYKQKAKNVLTMSEGRLKLDEADFKPSNKVENLMLEARQTLSDIGFVQIMLKLGFNKKIPPKN